MLMTEESFFIHAEKMTTHAAFTNQPEMVYYESGRNISTRFGESEGEDLMQFCTLSWRHAKNTTVLFGVLA